MEPTLTKIMNIKIKLIKHWLWHVVLILTCGIDLDTWWLDTWIFF